MIICLCNFIFPLVAVRFILFFHVIVLQRAYAFSDPSADRQNKETPKMPSYLRWPHIQADQVHGLGLREIGGFTKHRRAPSVRASCYAIAKPSTLVEKMQIIKRLRGHQNAVYCG